VGDIRVFYHYIILQATDRVLGPETSFFLPLLQGVSLANNDTQRPA
jgi:hypothetical protein